jgi:hypothetical protein
MTAQTPARAAADWWANAVGAPTFDAGADSPSLATAEVMASMLAATSPVSNDSATKFRDLLEQKIAQALSYDLGRGISLGVDYGPDQELGDIAQAAGISSSRFPWKTNMWVYHTHVIVSAGYAAPARLVWQAEDWERPACGDSKYNTAHEREPWKCGLPQYHEGDHDYTVSSPICGVVLTGRGEPYTCRRDRGEYVHTGSGEDRYADRAHDFVQLEA